MEGHNDPRHIHSYSKFIAGGIGGMVSQYDGLCMPYARLCFWLTGLKVCSISYRYT